jgi:hypothetical protein
MHTARTTQKFVIKNLDLSLPFFANAVSCSLLKIEHFEDQDTVHTLQKFGSSRNFHLGGVSGDASGFLLPQPPPHQLPAGARRCRGRQPNHIKHSHMTQ